MACAFRANKKRCPTMVKLGTSLFSHSVFVFWIFRFSKEYKASAVKPHKCAEGKAQAA